MSKMVAAITAHNFIQFMVSQGRRVVSSHGDIFVFNGKVFDLLDGDQFAKVVSDFVLRSMGVNYTYATNIREIVETVKQRVAVDSAWRPHFIGNKDKPAPVHVVGNGILTFDDTGNFTVGPHTDDLLATEKTKYNYDPKVKTCRKFHDFLKWFCEQDQGLYDLNLELMAAPLLRNFLDIQMFPVFAGPSGANGKSVRLNAQSLLYGIGNVSALTMESVGKPFALPMMEHKTLNVDTDINTSSKVAESQLKKLVDGSLLKYERKYQDPVTGRNWASLAFSCNLLPRVIAQDGGIQRRFLFIPCESRITGNRISNLESTFDFSGVLAMVLAVMPRLMANGELSIPPKVSDFNREVWQENNSVHLFLSEYVRLSAKSRQPKAELYQNYSNFCNRNGFKAYASSTFGRHVAAYFAAAVRSGDVLKRARTLDTREPAYIGIEFCPSGVHQELSIEALTEEIVEGKV